METDNWLRCSGIASCVNDMARLSTFVSRYGYTEDSAWRACASFGCRTGRLGGVWSGRSPVRVASASRSSGRRFGGGVLSSSLEECQLRVLFGEHATTRVHGPLPAATRRFSPLENADDVKRLFLRKRVDRNSSRWTKSDHCNAFDSHVVYPGTLRSTNSFNTGCTSPQNALGDPEN